MDMCFANDSNHKQIQNLYPVYQFQVNIETFQAKNVQTFNFALEKLDGIIQLRLTAVHNQSKMFLTTVGENLDDSRVALLPNVLDLLDNVTYQEIKTEQALQVNFQGFVDHLITILDSCRNNEL